MRRRAFAVFLAVAMPAGVLMADPKRELPAASASQQVAVDESGQLRPPTIVEQQLLATAVRPERPLVLNILSNGVMSIALDDRFDHLLVASAGAAGSLELTCTDDHDFVSSLVTAPAPPETILRIHKSRSNGRRAAERE